MMLDFYCHVDGDYDKPLQKIKIPDSCCGIRCDVHNMSGMGPSFLRKGCQKHFGTYVSIWKTFGPDGVYHAPSKGNSSVPEGGFKCVTCPATGFYAEANQPDGTYKCWACRNIWR